MLKGLVFAMFLASSCLSATASAGSGADQDALVLRAVLASQCAAGNGYVILSSMSVAPDESDDLQGVDESGALEDLTRRNESAVSLPEGLICNRVRLHDELEISGFLKPGPEASAEIRLDEAWKRFYESFPGATGWMSVSLPGYGPGKDIAIVYVADHCGRLCGQGTYVYLRRANDRWNVLLRLPVWKS